jgi:hypothetical protein
MMTEKTWRDLAFKAPRCDSDILKWMVTHKKSALLVIDRKGRSLLHVAVISHSYGVLDWMLDPDEHLDLSSIFCIRERRYHTPIEVALLSGWHTIISMLLFALDPSHPNVYRVLKRACKVAKDYHLTHIKLRLHQSKLQKLVIETLSCPIIETPCPVKD